MALNIGWTNRLVATESALRAAVEEIERVALRGLPYPGSAAPPMTPLPPEQWPPLQDGLLQISEEMEALVRSIAPKEARREHARQPLEATLYHLSVALLMLEEQVIDDLDPERVRGFGALEPSDKDQLALAVDRLRTRTRNMLNYVESLKSKRGNEDEN